MAINLYNNHEETEKVVKCMEKDIQLLTLEEAANILRCSTRTLRSRIKDGEINASLIGNKLLIEYNEIVRYIEKSKLKGE